MSIVDIGLKEIENNLYDIDFSSNGDFYLTETFETSLLVSIFEEKRADESEIPNPIYRRGWWGNILNDGDFENGSKLWMIYQSRATNETLSRAIDYIKIAINWFIEDNLADKINVSGYYENKGELFIMINIIKDDNSVESRLIKAWIFK